MLAHLKYTVHDGEYLLVGGDMEIAVRRYRGILYPFEQWEGWPPMGVVKQLQSGR
jgi:hypothetical protein